MRAQPGGIHRWHRRQSAHWHRHVPGRADAHGRGASEWHRASKAPYGASRTGPEEVHILIIGESARRASWSVYGYERKTTPFLEQLGGEAVFFQHAVADANYTARVVPILLTGMSPDRFDMASVRGNLVDLAREAGYSTAWLMNQDPHISLAVGVHADQMHYPPPISSVMSGHLPRDEVLLPDLQRALERRGAAQFIGLHVIGSHWEYLSRYPPSFERYDVGHDLGFMSASSPRSGQHVVNSYDNSVIYTDWFLQQVIERARKLSVRPPSPSSPTMARTCLRSTATPATDRPRSRRTNSISLPSSG